ncbi:YbgC/FadM family acyl-CoA thioesterase [Hyphomicrobium sp. D-2]|uniref:YbgC/FadM family acyl-CoA thioesterase n=1 Tax=Hyphomicrobium sp. D-2 TaxID=3041621 RepID=UPI00245703B8|nr:YbgC/FadM family acyl-CoA thioesterase [Hyphomicrobium sp. D-2]MDH4980890.1 YbgC/FadM family acyl-CoA thioesterase [Hyphomicrobium sp. D-2]
MTDTAAPRTWPDLGGRLIEIDGAQAHVLPVRVYFEDTDFSGLVYHASYVRWCERGRSDFLRLLGGDHRRLIDGSGGTEPAAFVVRRMTFDYLKPARIDDLLEVVTRVKAVGAASLTLSQSVQRNGVVLVEAEVTVVLITVSGKPLRISGALREAFSGA